MICKTMYFEDRMSTVYKIFQNGSVWLRADFHLHTRADKEFVWQGEDTQFVNNYIQKLKEKDVRIGVISNHNKFDLNEFKALRKKARSEEIFLLPAVELSVNDGENGIHAIIVFNEEWVTDGDYINQFLNVTFTGKTPDQYEHENGRSNDSLIETIKKLEQYNKDFFVIFAHVEQKSGLWSELGGGRMEELGKNELFLRRCYAFQKVRTHDSSNTPNTERACRTKIKGWFQNWYPAEVEGSDCKSIEEIGKGTEVSYLKVGDFTFEAVKFALLDCKNRLTQELKNYPHSYIKSISFEGGVLADQTIHLSPELNALIGIRGSGKSSILEAIRYVLDIPFGEKALDKDYKRALVEHSLGSGGKITLKAIDQRGQEYEISRILKEQPDVYVAGKLQPGISIRETIVYKPIYFGQKDLSSTGEGFEIDLVEKLLGEKLHGIRQRISEQKQKVTQSVEHLVKTSDVEEKKKEYSAKKQDAEFRLKFFKEHGVEERLKKQIDFDSDSTKCLQINSLVNKYLKDLEQLIFEYKDDLEAQPQYQSKQNEPFFKEYFVVLKNIIGGLNEISKILQTGKDTAKMLDQKRIEFEKKKEGLKEEFAQIERKLSEELKNAEKAGIRPDEFRQLTKVVEQASQMLESLSKLESQRSQLFQSLLNELDALNKLWHEEFKAIQVELEKVNRNHSSLAIKAEYKGDKDKFLTFTKDMFRGSKLREGTFQSIINAYADFGAVYKDINNVLNTVGTGAPIFNEYFQKSLGTFLTWQTPNRFIIEYRGKELKHHSLGQRASALILFVLSQRENDVVIIDQPEDDLDNQTIYEDVIKLIRDLKPKTQFIFATHNANFPVLGDADQILSCQYADDKMQIASGSIDSPVLQQEIVKIMEGGEEAFNRRKEIYQIWKL